MTAPTMQPWWADAACANYPDPEVFHPKPGAQATPALKVCRTCTVIGKCLDDVLTREGPSASWGHRHGVWGGTTPKQRAQLARCRAGRCQHANHRRDIRA